MRGWVWRLCQAMPIQRFMRMKPVPEYVAQEAKGFHGFSWQDDRYIVDLILSQAQWHIIGRIGTLAFFV